MMEVTKNIHHVLSVDLAKRLKEHGFNIHGRTIWNRHGDGYIQGIDIQLNKRNEGSSGSFTMNIGVFLTEFDKMADYPGRPDTGEFKPSWPRYHMGCRISDLMPDPRKDFWWKIDADTDLDALAADVGRVTEELVLPWLDERSDLDRLRTMFRKRGAHWHAAVVEMIYGNEVLARKLLKKQMRRSWWTRRTGAYDQCRAWGEYKGLLKPKATRTREA